MHSTAAAGSGQQQLAELCTQPCDCHMSMGQVWPVAVLSLHLCLMKCMMAALLLLQACCAAVVLSP